MNGTNRATSLGTPHGNAKPGSDLEARKETASIVIAGEEHFIFLCFVVAEHNELLHFVLYSAGLRHPCVTNKIKKCCSDRLSLIVTIKMCDFKNATHFTQSLR